MTDLGFVHIFSPGQSQKQQPVLLLLHGTGGDEHDLLDLAQDVLPGATILSVRGKVLENGMSRFFRRLAEGVFDLEDLNFRTRELAEFIVAAKKHYGIEDRPMIALGFSNGANIASALLLQYPDTLDGAILLRGMVPFMPDTLPDLTDKKILMLSGKVDPIMPPGDPQKLADMFTAAHADVTLVTHPLAGHGLVPADISRMQGWLTA